MPLNRADGLILGPTPISKANKLLDSLLGVRNISLSTQPPCNGRLILAGAEIIAKSGLTSEFTPCLVSYISSPLHGFPTIDQQTKFMGSWQTYT